MSISKTILRTLFYNWLLICIGISIGFISNAEWIGYKSLLVSKSIDHIFFPVEITPEFQKTIKEIGTKKIRLMVGNPSSFTILEDYLYDNEIYYADYEYIDAKGNKIRETRRTRIYWKNWEYYYQLDDSLRASKE